MKSLYSSIQQAIVSTHTSGTVVFPSMYIIPIVEALVPVFGPVHEDVITKNREAFTDILPSESVVTLDNSKLIASNLPFVICALVLDYKSISKILADALSLEFDIDALSADDRKQIRSKLRDSIKSSAHFMEYGTTCFSYSVWKELFDTFNASLSKIRNSRLEMDVNSKYSQLSESAANSISFLMCNYLYFLRAFCNNRVFHDDVLDICSAIRKEYHL